MKASLAKGTRDFLPLQAKRRKYIFKIIEDCFIHFGYQPLETPAIENLSTLTGKYGEEGDKLLFKILNSGDYLKSANEEFLKEKNSSKLIPSISEKGLRYDLTVPFARVVSMNIGKLSLPFKRYQIQPVWRADRPQRGRYREFYQCDADVVGSKSLMYEAELALIYDRVFQSLGIPVQIIINHRAILEGMAIQTGSQDQFVEMTVALDKLDKIGESGVREELLKLNMVVEKADWILNQLQIKELSQFRFNDIASKGVMEIEEVFRYVETSHPYNEILFEPRLARGLSYYTGCIFEVIPKNIQMGSLGGGGRYDNLTGAFGLPDVPGVGVSFGADRIYDVMEELNLFPEQLGVAIQVLFIALDNESHLACFKLANQLRVKGITVDIYPEPDKLKKQFKYAEDLKVPFVVIIGEKERQNELCNIKNQENGEQQTIAWGSLKSFFAATKLE
ncbi:MAG: histidine--tRNA ligase [Bacteroidota bacterium]|nr:histidine--tRNA ligase [Bacteroidota bacterium]